MRVLRRRTAAARLGAALVACVLWVAAGGAGHESALPTIVFVSRVAPSGFLSGQVPGLGPRGTFAGAGGRLLERASNGEIRELVGMGELFDVADPAPSPDGRRVAFAGRRREGGPWRLYEVSREDGTLRCLTCEASWPDVAGTETRGAGSTRGDDADPTWWGDTLLFVSSRGADRALYDASAVTQMWARAPDGQVTQLTFEPNGVLDPMADPARARVWFSRWWFNPWRPDSAGGVTRRAGSPQDSVNVWQVVSARLRPRSDGTLALDDLRLAAGGTIPRRRGMGIQPAVLADGDVVAVASRNTGLAPRPGSLAIQRFGKPPAAGVRVAGAAIGDDAGDTYTEAANLLAPAAVAPAALADGRIVLALDPGGRGDFGLSLLSADGARRTPLLDLPNTWELDPAPVPVMPSRGSSVEQAEDDNGGEETPSETEFRYLVNDVFAGEGAPPRTPDAQLHVYRLHARDSVERIRTVRVGRDGRVDVRLPADTPLFELLADSTGRALMSAHGPAQVRGFNTGAPGTTSRCVGCHLGHSAAK